MMMGGTASQYGNLAQLSKVSKEKPPKKETSPGPETFSNNTFINNLSRTIYIISSMLYHLKMYLAHSNIETVEPDKSVFFSNYNFLYVIYVCW